MVGAFFSAEALVIERGVVFLVDVAFAAVVFLAVPVFDEAEPVSLAEFLAGASRFAGARFCFGAAFEVDSFLTAVASRSGASGPNASKSGVSCSLYDRQRSTDVL